MTGSSEYSAEGVSNVITQMQCEASPKHSIKCISLQRRMSYQAVPSTLAGNV